MDSPAPGHRFAAKDVIDNNFERPRLQQFDRANKDHLKQREEKEATVGLQGRHDLASE
jgi:hypothetical protein